MGGLAAVTAPGGSSSSGWTATKVNSLIAVLTTALGILAFQASDVSEEVTDLICVIRIFGQYTGDDFLGGGIILTTVDSVHTQPMAGPELTTSPTNPAGYGGYKGNLDAPNVVLTGWPWYGVNAAAFEAPVCLAVADENTTDWSHLQGTHWHFGS